MFRIFMALEGRALPYAYLDSIHAAIVAGLTAEELSSRQLIGRDAAPWTFAAKGFSRPGGRLFLSGLTISTCDEGVGEALRRLKPENVRRLSSNGDCIDLKGARKIVIQEPFLDGQEELAICFASPFVLTQPLAGRPQGKIYVQTLEGIDFSHVFSKGLSRRLGRRVDIEAHADPLSVATDGAKPRIISLRRSPGGRVTTPAFAVHMTLRGATEDLRTAYYAGLGEKTRYGFGCPATLN